MCLLPILRGPCDAQLPRWGYNFLTGQCQQFYFGGCQGNRNNYLTQEVCELACVRKFYLPELFAHGRHLFLHHEINLLKSSIRSMKNVKALNEESKNLKCKLCKRNTDLLKYWKEAILKTLTEA